MSGSPGFVLSALTRRALRLCVSVFAPALTAEAQSTSRSRREEPLIMTLPAERVDSQPGR